jgi:alpha-beta hydrolase superfamily lysophospholipase
MAIARLASMSPDIEGDALQTAISAPSRQRSFETQGKLAMSDSDQAIIGRFPVGYYPLHPNVSLNFQMDRFWNWVGDKQMLDELKAAGARIANYDDWAREMFDLSDKTLAAGRRLPAAYYSKMAIFFLDPSDARVKPAFQRFLDNVLRENKVPSDNHYQVPYQGKQLSAHRFTPAQPRGTMVVFGGYDSYLLEWLPMALALRDAGMDTIIFDGPGQGVALDDGITMTPDWHLPVAAIADHFAIADLTLLGFSLGGRAAARELRISRVIAMDICTSAFEAGTRGFGPTGLSVIAANSEQMPASLVNAAVATVRESDLLINWLLAQGERVMGVTSPAEVFHAWHEYTTADISSEVKQDVLLMAGAKDHYIPLLMLPDQLMTLTTAHSVTARVFTVEESGQNHCQIGNMGLALKVILGWLDETGGRRS